MDDAKAKKWLVSQLRRLSLKWPPALMARDAAKTRRKRNKETNRIAWHFRCASCSGEFPMSKLELDHIKPVVDPRKGFIDWNKYIPGLFSPYGNYQALCGNCHKQKTEKENEERKKIRSS